MAINIHLYKNGIEMKNLLKPTNRSQDQVARALSCQYRLKTFLKTSRYEIITLINCSKD